jgi:hypothetical protein
MLQQYIHGFLSLPRMDEPCNSIAMLLFCDLPVLTYLFFAKLKRRLFGAPKSAT